MRGALVKIMMFFFDFHHSGMNSTGSNPFLQCIFLFLSTPVYPAADPRKKHLEVQEYLIVSSHE